MHAVHARRERRVRDVLVHEARVRPDEGPADAVLDDLRLLEAERRATRVQRVEAARRDVYPLGDPDLGHVGAEARLLQGQRQRGVSVRPGLTIADAADHFHRFSQSRRRH